MFIAKLARGLAAGEAKPKAVEDGSHQATDRASKSGGKQAVNMGFKEKTEHDMTMIIQYTLSPR